MFNIKRSYCTEVSHSNELISVGTERSRGLCFLAVDLSLGLILWFSVQLAIIFSGSNWFTPYCLCKFLCHSQCFTKFPQGHHTGTWDWNVWKSLLVPQGHTDVMVSRGTGSRVPLEGPYPVLTLVSAHAFPIPALCLGSAWRFNFATCKQVPRTKPTEIMSSAVSSLEVSTALTLQMTFTFPA